LILWGKYGMPVFKLDEGTLSSLVLTDPTNVPSDLVRLPFQSFILELPKGFINNKSKLLGEDKVVDDSISCVLVFNQLVPSKSRITVDPQTILDDSIDWISINIMGDYSNVFSDSYSFNHTRDIGEFLRIKKKKEGNSQLFGNQCYKLDQTDEHIITAVKRIIINLCLLIQDCGTTSKCKRSSVLRHINRYKTDLLPTIHYLNKVVPLNKNLSNAAKDWISSQKSRTVGWSIKKRFVVRGHWRNQVCGKGLSDRCLKWIEPYWKGPNVSEVIRHIYTPMKEAV
jgi:hypothetical protein